MHRDLVARRVLVVCAAGASSTFLVHWMRKVAAADGLDIVIEAGSQSDLGRRLPELDAVLIGSHLSEAFPQVKADAASAGVSALLLPAVGFDAAGASIALGLLEELLAASAGARTVDDDRATADNGASEDHAGLIDRAAVSGDRRNPGSSHG